MQIFFSNKFTAVYSSYRHLFHNKKSTTVFIKLEVRWIGKREESTFWNEFSTEAQNCCPKRPRHPVRDGGAFPSLGVSGREWRSC